MKGIFIFTCLIILPLISVAQDDRPDTTLVLKEIVFSVNRWEQDLREVPGRISKVNASLVQFQNPQTAADLLGISNQVFVQKSQLGGGSPMIRGFAANRVLLVVDGVRMNNAIFRSGNVQNVISIDANAVENAEVIFGPGSVIYGSDAIGGVMDFHTLRTRLATDKKTELSVNAMTRYSTANKENATHIDFNIGLEKWGFRTSITHSGYSDLKQGSNGPTDYLRPDYVVRNNGADVVVPNPDPNRQVPTGYSQWNMMQKVRYRPSPSWDVNYAIHYSETSDYARYDRLILKNSHGNFTNAEWNYGPQAWLMNVLSVGYLSPAKLSDNARFTLAYQNYKESRHTRIFGSSNRTNRFEEVNAFSSNLDLDKKINEKIEVFYGGEFVTNMVGSAAHRVNIDNETISPATTRYPDGSDWRTLAAYLSMKLKLSKRWLMTTSARFTHVYTHARYDTALFEFPFTEATLRNKSLNGSAGLVYSPSDQWKIYTNFSSGFRAPNVDDIGKVFDSEPGNVVVPNPGLKPEQAYNVELGIAATVAENFNLDFGVYYSTITNVIARASSTFNGRDSINYDGSLSRVLSLQNISEMYVTGLQAGIDWNLTRHLQLTSNINYQNGKEKDPQTGRDFSPAHVAPLFGSTHFIFSNKKIKTDLYANYNGSIDYSNLALSERADAHLYAKDDNGNPYSPSWWTLNFKFSAKVIKNLSLDAGAENILDKRYRPYSSGISAPGRNFIFTLRVSL